MGSDSRWRQTAWLEGALAWIDDRLKAAGLARVGQVEQPHVTFWATVLRVPIEGGNVYFKAVSPAYGFEIPLTEFLTNRWPAIAPSLLAFDADNGWMLMQDGGSRLRELLQSELGTGRWESVLKRYAQLQKETLAYVPELLDFGTPDRCPEVLVERFNQFLAYPDRLVCDDLSQDDVDQLLQSSRRIAHYADELEGLGIGVGLDHGDFHDGNIFVKNGEYIFFDWGDAGLTHPFFSLRTAFVSLENSLGLEEDNPVFDQLSGHYLQYWTDWAPIEVLRRAYLLSRPLASINAAVRWQAAIDDLPIADRTSYRTYVPSLLSEVLTYMETL